MLVACWRRCSCRAGVEAEIGCLFEFARVVSDPGLLHLGLFGKRLAVRPVQTIPMALERRGSINIGIVGVREMRSILPCAVSGVRNENCVAFCRPVRHRVQARIQPDRYCAASLANRLRAWSSNKGASIDITW